MPGDEPTFVSVMVEARDVKLWGVEKVLRAALISASPMVKGRDAPGAALTLNLAMEKFLVAHSLGGRLDYVQLTVLWFGTKGFMVVQLYELFRILKPSILLS